MKIGPSEKQLSRGAGELLLRLIEQPSAVVLGSTLDNFGAEFGRELILAGALVPDGFSRSVTLFDDDGARNVDLEWFDNRQAFGYFTAADGYVFPEPASLQFHRVNLGWWLNWLASALGLVNATRPIELVPDHARDLGDLWVSKRNKVPVILTRRLNSTRAISTLTSTIGDRPARQGGVILSSRPRSATLTAWPHRFTMVKLSELLAMGSADFALEPRAITELYVPTSSQGSAQLFQLSPDNSWLTIQGESFFLLGEIHRKLMRILVDALQTGQKLPTKHLLMKAGSGSGAIHRAFRGCPAWPAIEKILRIEDKHCWIEL